ADGILSARAAAPRFNESHDRGKRSRELGTAAHQLRGSAMGAIIWALESVLPIKARGPHVHAGAGAAKCSGGDQASEQRGSSRLCAHESPDYRAGQTSEFNREDDGVIHVAGCGARSAADAACGDGDRCGPRQLLCAGSAVSFERRSCSGAGFEAGTGRGRVAETVGGIGEAHQRAVASLSGSMNLRLTDKTALVSGSTKGIGFAIATGLARERVQVIVHGRSEKAVAEAKEHIGP